MNDLLLRGIRQSARDSISISRDAALEILENERLDTDEILSLAEIPRKKHFENFVQIHILDNIRNGSCGEDCSYCAQRKGDSAEEIPQYSTKEEEEILAEARAAFESGAFRFCMVTSGRGPSRKSIAFYSSVIRKIKERYPIHICLSAGILTDPALAGDLAAAGLDRYNHNLNTSDARYAEICTTHTFQDRLSTLANMRQAGVSLCSGVIAGMGESSEDLVDVAFRLREANVESIPVNFFLPVPGHAVKNQTPLSPEKCLRILSMFRLVNPASEIRMAAGREFHIRERQKDALRAANSLFVSGYLNVKGSNAEETFRLIVQSGYRIDSKNSDLPIPAEFSSEASIGDVSMKSIEELRPFRS